MPVTVMTEQPESPTNKPAAATPPQTQRRYEPTVREIVEKARATPASSRGAWCVSLATSVLLWASFTPLDWGWLGWIALAPLCLLIRLPKPTRAMYRVAFAAGLAWSLPTLQWMRLGDVSMYPAWFALAFYLALYFPVFIGTSRVAVQRLRLPLVVAVPVCWTGFEYLRAQLMTGFAWYFLGHTQHAWPEMIQISDVVGAYGVSFLVALSCGCVAAMVPEQWLKSLGLFPPVQVPAEFSHLPQDGMLTETPSDTARPQWIMVGATLSLIVAALGYGVLRRTQADFKAGPRVALVQGNFPTSLKHDPNEAVKIYRIQEALTGMSVKHQPDLVVWPETMFRWPLREKDVGVTDDDLLAIAPPFSEADRTNWIQSWNDPQVRATLRQMSEQSGAAMLIGIDTWVARKGKFSAYNSAAFVTPTEGYLGRYDKLHRVIFGEYIPLKETIPALAALTPFPEDFGIEKGLAPKVFEHKNYSYAPIICFEDTVPEISRTVKRDAPKVDVLVNLTNDGWFAKSSELDQHLITACFRAVECRTPMVRSVNTGISAVIDGDGVVVEPLAFIDGDRATPPRDSMRDPKSGRWHKDLNAAIVADVPLDNRTSLYVRHGDWFAGSCGGIVLLLALAGLVTRSKQR